LDRTYPGDLKRSYACPFLSFAGIIAMEELQGSERAAAGYENIHKAEKKKSQYGPHGPTTRRWLWRCGMSISSWKRFSSFVDSFGIGQRLRCPDQTLGLSQPGPGFTCKAGKTSGLGTSTVSIVDYATAFLLVQTIPRYSGQITHELGSVFSPVPVCASTQGICR